MRITHTTGLTIDDYVVLKQQPEHDFTKIEIIAGELLVRPAPRHVIAWNFLSIVGPKLRRSRRGVLVPGAIGVRVAPDEVVYPDLGYVSRERWLIIEPDQINGVPEVMIKIISAKNREQDWIEIEEGYKRFGLAEYWIIDPKGEYVAIYARGDDGQYEESLFSWEPARSTVVPELEISVGQLLRMFPDSDDDERD